MMNHSVYNLPNLTHPTEHRSQNVEHQVTLVTLSVLSEGQWVK